MDILSDIFETLGLKGTLYFRTDFSGNWGVVVPDFAEAARFHLVVQGVCHVRLNSGDTVCLRAGDMILIPQGCSHILSDTPDRVASPLETVIAETGYSGKGVFVAGEGDSAASTQMICGHFSFRQGAGHLLLNALPESITVTSATRAKEVWLDEMLRLVSRWVFSERIGTDGTVIRLSEIVFFELLRLGLTDNGSDSSVWNAFQDKNISQAINLIHEQPSAPWSVERLANEVGMSRSRFAEKFKELTGTAPMAYLADWRFQKALAMLGDTQSSVQQIAIQTGYQSAAAFTRAFAGKFGYPPTEYRQQL